MKVTDASEVTLVLSFQVEVTLEQLLRGGLSEFEEASKLLLQNKLDEIRGLTSGNGAKKNEESSGPPASPE